MKSEILIETKSDRPNNFTQYIRLKETTPKKVSIIDVGHVDYFIYPFQKECYVSWLNILPCYRNKKFGSHLMKAVITHAQKAHCTHIRLLAPKGYDSPIPFYEKLDFVVTKDDNYECKTLELHLTQPE